MTPPRRFVLSGCSGGGKSTLLAEMAQRGYPTVPEPGRRVIAKERAAGGNAFPWRDPQAFAYRAIDMAMADAHAAKADLTLFDRSALDALNWFDQTKTPLDPAIRRNILNLGYATRVFLFPPWPKIYRRDSERQHGWDAALAEYQSLCDRLPEYGFSIVDVPKLTVAERADWFEAALRNKDEFA